MNWRAMMCAMVLGAALPLFANAANVSIKPQPLASALQDLAKQSDVQIIFLSNAVEGRHAAGLNGTYTPEEAVALLLEGSGLTYYVLNDRTIEVAAKPATPTASPGTAVPAVPLDEVEVIAQREKLEALRAEIQRLEEQFYAEYNEVNTSPEYDFVCTTETNPNSRLAQRVCVPAYLGEATRVPKDFVCPKVMRTGSHVARYTGGRVAQQRCGEMFVARLRCANPETLAKTAEYKKSMTNVLARHPELRKLMQEHQELAQRYEALQKQHPAGAKDMASPSRTSAVALVPCPSESPRGRVPPDIRGFDYPIQGGSASITLSEQAALNGVSWPP
jgi:hypothetical protein